MGAGVNWFKLYIGDYQRDTAHLSVTEHGAYLLMLQHYYATEKPLPTGKALHRMLRAQDKDEREAIDTVAAQFWTDTPAGLVNGRADAELTKAGAQADTNRAIAQAREARRKAAREPHDDSTNRATKAQPNQTPDTRHQTPTIKDGEFSTTDAPAPNLPPDPRAGPDDDPPPPPSLAGRACLACRGANVHDVNPSHPDLLRLLAAGVTPEAIGATAAELVGAGKPARFAYVLRTVESRLQQVAARPALQAAAPADPMAWADSRSEVVNMGNRLGIGPFEELDRSTGMAGNWTAYRRSVIAAWQASQGATA